LLFGVKAQVALLGVLHDLAECGRIRRLANSRDPAGVNPCRIPVANMAVKPILRLGRGQTFMLLDRPERGIAICAAGPGPIRRRRRW
jgi:hypothetical protein